MNKLTLIVITLILSLNIQASKLADTTFYKYYIAVEFSFNEEKQEYVQQNMFVDSGSIMISPKLIRIDNYNGSSPFNFIVTSIEKEKESDRTLYNTFLNNTEYTIAIPKDKSYITQIGFNDKTIYDLRKSMASKQKKVFINANPQSKKKEEIIYLFEETDNSPLFNQAKDQKESEELIKGFITNKIKEYNVQIDGKAFVDILIDKDGKTFKTSTVYGKNPKLNSIALEIIQNMPDWTPGMKKGEKVPCTKLLELKFE